MRYLDFLKSTNYKEALNSGAWAWLWTQYVWASLGAAAIKELIAAENSKELSGFMELRLKT
jgi:hypothetical protein